ncbi:S8 family peptidase [Bacillus suaedae]|uniref:Peptidase S8 n=1 Tax=Halalkalibacter suaedae TaxID=2822140 RepID=A0A940WRD2_9BACI|nr:S8 family peptidase [Bacillus suaedae]MBP3950926.1 peptidase S8 [Bacillus suaedae]
MTTTKQLIVCFKPGTKRTSCMHVHDKSKAKLVKELKDMDIHVVNVSTEELSSCLSGYTASEDVQYVEEDYRIQVEPIEEMRELSSVEPIRTTASTTDPLFARQWGLENINAQAAWELARTSTRSAKIAILDTGVNQIHPDLRGKVIHQTNLSDALTAEDVHGHGTHVAGIAAAITNNGKGISGISYNAASIMNIKVLDDTGGGSSSDVAQGIIYATNRGANIINLSLGSEMSNETLRNAVRYAASNGVLLVGAAGNNGSDKMNFPAAYDDVLAVTATNRNNELAEFSNYGSWVDVAAPGEDILSTFSGELSQSSSLYRVVSGTSQATPFISGLAGLLKASNPALTKGQIRAVIQRSSIPVSPGTIRFGKVDAMKAIELSQNAVRSLPGKLPPVWWFHRNR